MTKSAATNEAVPESSDPFVLDLKKIREDARKHMSDGPVTQTYGADRTKVLKLLNDALATEIVCTLRYKRHYFMARGINSEAVAQEFAQHATEEQEHADRIAERIVQLGGEPDFAPDGLKTRAHSEYKEGTDLTSMIGENLVAERIAIDTYREIIRYLGDKDVTTRRLFEEILAVEEEHADDMADLLQGRGQSAGGA
ncbi:bacterioferritin [Burkholderia pseudomultivorans]|uniref:Ferritin-like domain protein n=1 Tax=Burkholderia cenocepacia TaxID=95486 RepID=A0AAN0RUE8_9BURK|nr:ferritin-like domain-containing protein [Burkholderia pseudomultivorans]AIO34127.1 ferritin-like domain protein [Burkholderia cenocepacia]EGD02071.1 bacterioferritin [Burkholderia sp. TJI49]AOI92206.1 bacterioferritin [Burkholderia pseudomultivorans]KVC26128.1 bacterioferritin [Burkholderia pseudomultivorans]KVC33580.1 bacterioferritin [Burkholderia pseudomultivorans]